MMLCVTPPYDRMMRIVVIGATGHIGTFLIPRLVRGGHEVVAVSRGTREPYATDDAWHHVERVHADRDAEDAAGTFGSRIADLGADGVIDLVCFTETSARQLVDALGTRENPPHLVHCGTIWTHGLSEALPLREDETDKHPLGDYGVQKWAIEQYLRAQNTVPFTVIHPGHISGPGWPVINPVGNLDPAVWTTLAAGEPLRIPGIGAETMHHVHADDVAQLFELAVTQRDAASGHSFHAVAAQALTVRGFAAAAAAWFGQEADLHPVSWDEFRASTSAENADASWQHLSRSQVGSIEQGIARLGYAPRYTADEAARQAVEWLIEHDGLDVAGRSIASA